MALLWMDGFDHYGTGATGNDNMLRGLWAGVNTSGAAAVGITNSTSRTGSCSMRISESGVAGNPRLRRVFGASYDVVGFAGVYFLSTLPEGNEHQFVQFRDSDNAAQIGFVITSTGAIRAYRGSYSALLGTSADAVVVASAWQHIEFACHIHDSAGWAEVRVNGVTVLSLSGIDTKATSLAGAAQVALSVRQAGPATAGPNYYIDDIFAWNDQGDSNNSFIGDKRVGLITPNDDTAQADWTPAGSVTGFGAISEIPQDADTTYIEAQDAGYVSEFELQDAVGDIGAISAVQTYVIQRKTVAGVCNTRVGLVSDAAETLGADRPVTEQYTYYTDMFESDPNTAAPWTKTGLSAARLKIERAA